MENCFVMQPDGGHTRGVPVGNIGVRGYMQLGYGEAARNIRYRVPPPLVTHRLIQEASPFKDTANRPYLQCRREWQGAIIRVDTRILRFDAALSTHLPCVMNAWPGIEQVEQPFAQAGRWHLLVALENGEHCFACDNAKRYLRVDCKHCAVFTSAADPKELAACLISRALYRVHTHAGLIWTLRTIENLGSGHLWPDELSKRLAKLSKCRKY